MYKNLFVRPFLIYTHLSGQSVVNGSAYGANGKSSNQLTGLIEFGWLLGDAKQQ